MCTMPGLAEHMLDEISLSVRINSTCSMHKTEARRQALAHCLTDHLLALQFLLSAKRMLKRVACCNVLAAFALHCLILSCAWGQLVVTIQIPMSAIRTACC